MISCPECKNALPIPLRGEPTTCPKCKGCFYFYLFPALLRNSTASAGQSKITGAESSCFYHPQKIASRSCDYCGRLVCALCEIPVNNQHICPTCLAKGKEGRSASANFQSHAMPDTVALSIAFLSSMIWPITLVSAPFTFYYIIKNYKKPLGILPRYRWRYWLAGIIALLQLSAWLYAFRLLSIE